MTEQKIIVTADDYGVFDEIDRGVLEAVSAGKINSVAAFANYGNKGQLSRKKAEQLLKIADNSGHELHLGIHLTISSGKPLTGINGFEQSCTLRGFRDFKNVEEIDQRGKERLMDELHAQMKVFEGLPIRHLTSHHDALTYHRRHFECLLELARDYDLPIRNYRYDPEQRNKMEFICGTDWISLRKLDQIKEAFENEHQLQISMPDVTYVGQYATKYNLFWNRFKKENVINRASEKRRELEGYIERLAEKPDPHKTEIVSHIIAPKVHSQKHYRQLVKKYNYKGVSPAYFDGRLLEMYTLMDFEAIPNLAGNLKWGVWKDG
ncbi:ChbG/HpnK family deacetylase [Reichenbachiella ulvae]|uniref:ChbG/HpnK family deacetylase n=1 Tax=Reichenbachiella ulvae TaxID=2980104 RepID=A0ABT3CR57_9BACT|nr:ChbG/HpnK family deacetylase [Reichenbachiella ulvae]MCV9385965.1 ChbG/HpnK family deacetylase [Reichenbachiella ulvae]